MGGLGAIASSVGSPTNGHLLFAFGFSISLDGRALGGASLGVTVCRYRHDVPCPVSSPRGAIDTFDRGKVAL